MSEAISKEISSLAKCDKKYLWHPFTQMQDWEKSKPIIIKSGRGTKIKDICGREYIDGVSSLWVNLHGHRKAAIDNAIKKQLSLISHSTLLGLSNIPSIKLAEELVKIVPKGLTRVFYSDNGSSAVEIALKMAFQYFQQQMGKKNKTKFVHLHNSYHGDTIGAVSVSGISTFHKKFAPLLFKTFEAPSFYCYRCPWNKEKIEVNTRFEKSSLFSAKKGECKEECLKKLEEIFKKHHKEIAALILEPLVQGAGGIIVAPYGYLKKARELCNKYSVLMIADEVAVGFGRTGKMFACEHENVSADIFCVAKGISGGYLPLAATIATEKIFGAFLGKFEELRTFFHGHSYTGNPLACAAGLANLEIFRRERVLEALQSKIKLLRKELIKFAELSSVGDIRQCGFMAGIELVENKFTKEPYPFKMKMGYKICMKVREKGLILRPLGDVIVIIPPLSISLAELNKMLDIIYGTIKENS